MEDCAGWDENEDDVRLGTVMRSTVLAVLGSAIAVLITGNLVILGVSATARQFVSGPRVDGVHNFEQVDAKVWRGAAPTTVGYQSLATLGVATIVDLRAEHGTAQDDLEAERLGMRTVHLAIRDGQTPTAAQVRTFLDTVRASAGPVFVHCGAGVGRTGTMAAAYLVESRGKSRSEALRRNLAVGPPSLEQIAFVAKLEPGKVSRPSFAVTATSRFLDAPRRIMHNLGV